MSRLANTRIYFVLLRGLVAVTRKVLQFIVALRNKVETFLSEKRNTVLLRFSKFKRGLKLTYLSYIYIYIYIHIYIFIYIYIYMCVCVCQHKNTKFSVKGRDQTEICPTQKLTAFKGKLLIVRTKTEEHDSTTFPNWTCFWKIKGWVSGTKKRYLEYLEELFLDSDRSILEDVTKYSCVCVCVCVCVRVFAAYLTSTSKIGWWHFKHC
jgi:hypothetical protein